MKKILALQKLSAVDPMPTGWSTSSICCSGCEEEEWSTCSIECGPAQPGT